MKQRTSRPAAGRSGPNNVSVPFLDLKAMHAEIQAELDCAWRAVTSTNAYIGGSVLDRFEGEWAAYCGRRYCIGVANGTDAIELALAASGVGPGDEVIVPANTFIATVEAVIACGARPVLVDIDDRTLLVTADHIRAAVTSRTAAVIVVHLYGQPAGMDEILAFTEPRGLLVVEDAAQAHGARWHGVRAGALGDIAAFSFYPGKNLGAFGDGGAVVTDDAAVASRVRALSTHGVTGASRYHHGVVGRNSRLDALQAAVLSVKLARLGGWNAARRRASLQYGRVLAGVKDARPVANAPEAESSHHLQVVRVPRRDAVRTALADRGVETGVHYPVPCHQHEPYRAFAEGPLPVAERAASEVLSLPMSPHISAEQVMEVCSALREAVEGQVGRAS
ncbi:MAG: aminotransferase class I/II-fold pyridoxal phosphate-dependent enzyme [Dehalococcoidia bacterium]|nr:aminotransferase class I/II-fold pyridoxal phosphate-dependent enzyme [Dehalococcoidia bacterium]